MNSHQPSRTSFFARLISPKIAKAYLAAAALWFVPSAPAFAGGYAAALSTGSATIVFNDFAGTNAPLNGEFPAGEVDWGAGSWFVAGPFNQFATKSVSFASGGQTSGTIDFLTPRRLVSLVAHNGAGGVSTTVSLQCAGQPRVQFVLAVNEVRTLETGWTGNCDAVNVESTNGWDTNFDDIVHDQVLGASPESAAFGDVFAYPNPFQPALGHTVVTFTGLPETATLRVYSVGGRDVVTLRESDGDGVYAWNVKDDEGNALASGVYVYVIESGTDEKVGKIVVVR